MKIFIKYDDRNYRALAMLCLFVVMLALMIVIFEHAHWLLITFLFLFMIGILILAFMNQKMGLLFDYEKEIITIRVPGQFRKVILMSEIKEIRLIEIIKKRKKRFYGNWDKYSRIGFIDEPKYVYRKGKIFNIEFLMKKDIKHTVFYGLLYKTRSTKRIDKQVTKINEAIQLFIKLRLQKMKNKQKEVSK